MTEVLIVGNGPSLLGSELGVVIDSYDIVVRFNNYRTEGYEQDVGTKTTIWSRYRDLEIERDSSTFNQIWVVVPPVSCTDEFRSQLLNNIPSEFHSSVKTYPSEKVAHQTAAAAKVEHPTSGLLAIEHFLSEGYNVTIAGIDCERKYPYHYFDPHGYCGDNHDGESEKVYIRMLLQEGKVKQL